MISLVEFVYYLLVDIFSFLKERTERQDQDLPPASKLFVSVPANMKLKKYSTSNLNKRIYLAWDQQLSQRIRKNSEFTRNMYHE